MLIISGTMNRQLLEQPSCAEKQEMGRVTGYKGVYVPMAKSARVLVILASMSV